MSRTYRVRHLPRIGGKKYVDASLRHFDRRMRDLAEEIIPGKPKRGEWSDLHYTLVHKWMILNSPVECKTQHPLVSWGRISASKVWYKKDGNQRIRQHNRQMLKFRPLDDDIDQRVKFYDKKDGWDNRVLW